MPTRIIQGKVPVSFRAVVKRNYQRTTKCFMLPVPVKLTTDGKPRSREARKKVNALWQKAAEWEDRTKRGGHIPKPKVLKVMRGRVKSRWVCTNPHTGRPYKERRKWLRGLCRDAGVEHKGLYAFRRYGGSAILQRGSSLTEAAHFLCHDNVRTAADCYAYLLNDDLSSYLATFPGSTPAGTPVGVATGTETGRDGRI